MNKILLVEDDKSIVENLREFLRGEGFEIETAAGQSEAMERIRSKADSGDSFDLALLDISLPDGNGYAVCSYIKEVTDTPVIFLTASGDEYSVVAGFNMGADDYISKPFRPRELVSRIKNTLRRSGNTQTVFEAGDLKIDSVKGTVYKKDKEVYLSALEYRLLLVFLNNRGIVLSRNKLLEEIWDIAGEFVNDNTLTVYIKRLREKIENDPGNPEIIKTIRGLGYRI